MVKKDEDLEWTTEFSNMEFIGDSDKSSFSEEVQGEKWIWERMKEEQPET